jgi:hypothetical protein
VKLIERKEQGRVTYMPALWDDHVESALGYFVVASGVHRDAIQATGPEPDWFRQLFPAPPRPAADLPRQIRDLIEWTGWSARQLGDVLGTSHTTVLALQQGRRPHASRTGDLPDRVEEAHGVVERIRVIAGAPDLTARALERGSEGARSAVEELRRRRPARAYLAALDALRRRETGDLLVGDRPARGDATVALTD